MGRAVESRAKPGPRLWVLVGGPLSIALGFVLAIVALTVGSLHEGSWAEFGPCTERGGEYQNRIPGKDILYLDEGWGGFPPRERCSVYLLDRVSSSGQPLSAEETLRRAPPPHRRIAHFSLPGDGTYVWVFALLVAPTAIWAAFALGTWLKRRREWRWYAQQR